MPDGLLIVDDDPGLQLAIREFMESRGFRVKTAGSVAEAKTVLRQDRFEMVILDYQLPDGDSLALLGELHDEDPNLPVILLTGHGSIDLAVRAMKAGAENFLTKPVQLKALEMVVKRALESRRLSRHYLAAASAQGGKEDPFIGRSRAIRGLEEEARVALRTDSPVLIQGATGVGKGVLARWLHRHGRRSEGAIVDINCAGLSAQLLDTELFGHERGAFTGAVAQKKGLLEAADRGVLFLDEIGDTEPGIQAKLLKVVEEKRFHRVGSVRDIRVDIQLLAATNRDLRKMTSDGSFRNDLYFRISTLVLRVPSLAERREDLPEVAEALLQGLAAERGQPPRRLSADAQKQLQDYSWPGNIRELRNVLERAVLVSGGTVIEPRHLRLEPPELTSGDAEPSRGSLDEVERREIERVLAATRGVVAEAAKSLGVSRGTLYSKLKLHGLDLEDFRPG